MGRKEIGGGEILRKEIRWGGGKRLEEEYYGVDVRGWKRNHYEEDRDWK